MTEPFAFNVGNADMYRFDGEADLQAWIDDQLAYFRLRRTKRTYWLRDHYRLDSGLYADGIKEVYAMVIPEDRPPSMQRRYGRPRTLVKAGRRK